MKTRLQNFAAALALVLLAFIMWAGVGRPAHAAETIPREARAFQRDYVRICHSVWKAGAPCATMAAQIHQESGWNCNARSSVGAQGCAQFMPATAADYPDEQGRVLPSDPRWSFLAQNRYLHALHSRASAATPCDRMSKALAAYNGGEGWLRRDEALAARLKLDPQKWESVAQVNAGRAPSAKTENNGYPARILFTLEPRYIAARWGAGSCTP